MMGKNICSRSSPPPFLNTLSDRYPTNTHKFPFCSFTTSDFRAIRLNIKRPYKRTIIVPILLGCRHQSPYTIRPSFNYTFGQRDYRGTMCPSFLGFWKITPVRYLGRPQRRLLRVTTRFGRYYLFITRQYIHVDFEYKSNFYLDRDRRILRSNTSVHRRNGPFPKKKNTMHVLVVPVVVEKQNKKTRYF